MFGARRGGLVRHLARLSGNDAALRSKGAFGCESRRFNQGPPQGNIRKRRQRFHRRHPVGPSARQGLGKRAATFEQAYRPVEIVGSLLSIFESAPPERPLLSVAAGESDYDRQRDL